MNLFYVILVLLVTGVIVLFNSSEQDKAAKKRKALFDKLGLRMKQGFAAGKYIAGHPNINDLADGVVIYPKGNEFVLLNVADKVIGSIPMAAIEDIAVEDRSSIDKRITLGRVVLVGVLALAWRKNKKTDQYFLTISWQQSKFTHNTLFEFDGVDGMKEANTARNKLLFFINRECDNNGEVSQI